MNRVAALPAMLTLGNFGCGFAAIVLAARSLIPAKAHGALPMGGESINVIYFACACIFLAMIFDMLDGKVARMTGTAGKFGGELDSLADVVSFGIAPAAIFTISWISVEPASGRWWSFVMVCGFIYAAMACVRLARYNVEMGVTAKDCFYGLPSPAAGGAVVSLFMVVHSEMLYGPVDATVAPIWVHYAMAFYMLIIGLLMVTRVRYGHMANRYLSGRKRLSHLVIAIFLLGLLVVYPVPVLAIGFNGYAMAGLVGEAMQWMRRRSSTPDAPVSSALPAEDADAAEESA